MSNRTSNKLSRVFTTILAVLLVLLSACSGGSQPKATQAPDATVAGPGATSPAVEPTATEMVIEDFDADGAPDATDLCLLNSDPAQSDLDADGVGDACDADLDGDNLANVADACPFNAGDTCSVGEPVVVEMAAPADSPVATVRLVGFTNPDPLRPDLLNVLVTPSGEIPLWTEVNDFELTLDIAPIKGLGDGTLAGTLAVMCPATWGGDCTGSLTVPAEGVTTSTTGSRNKKLYKLLMDGLDTLTGPCAVGNARCALGLAAAGLLPADNVWGAYDDETNEVNLAGGLPVPLGLTTTGVVSGTVGVGNSPFIELTTAPPSLSLPFTLEDPTGDCTPNPDCASGIDINKVTIDLSQITDPQPSVGMTIDTVGDIPTSNVFFGLIALVQTGDALVPEGLEFRSYSFVPGGAGQPWQLDMTGSKPWLNGNWGASPQVGATPTLEVSGNTANLTVPLILADSYPVIWLDVTGIFITTGQADYVRAELDPNQRPSPLLMFAWPEQKGPPLPVFPQHEELADQEHIFSSRYYLKDFNTFAPPSANCGDLAAIEAEFARNTRETPLNLGLKFLLSQRCNPVELNLGDQTYSFFDAFKEGDTLISPPVVDTPPVQPQAPSESVAGKPEADVQVTVELLTAADVLITPGTVVTGRMTIVNHGPATATGLTLVAASTATVNISLRLPDGSKLADGKRSEVGDIIYDTPLPDLPPNGSLEIEITMEALKSGSVVAVVKTQSLDSNPLNNDDRQPLVVDTSSP